MGTFDRQVASAKKLIEKNGALCYLQTNTNGTADPNKPWLPTIAEPVETAVRIAFFPTNNQTMKKLQYITGTEVPSGLETGYMAQSGVVPTLKDTIRRPDGKVWRIKDIDVINPNDEQDILYIITVQQ